MMFGSVLFSHSNVARSCQRYYILSLGEHGGLTTLHITVKRG